MHFTLAEEAAILKRSQLEHLMSLGSILDIKNKYSHPSRHYHDWNHALAVLSWANHVAEELLHEHAMELKVAALFHDVVYDEQGTPSNEQRSADHMLAVLGQTEVTALAHRLIMVTSLHGKLNRSDFEDTREGQLKAYMLDCDIASFGEKRWEVAQWHDDNIIKELLLRYTPEQIAGGRKQFLGGLLCRDGVSRPIFLSDYFYFNFEAQARRNIERLIKGQG
jgi:predicted metal-dependent HD superfamily phosphohydrolase